MIRILATYKGKAGMAEARGRELTAKVYHQTSLAGSGRAAHSARLQVLIRNARTLCGLKQFTALPSGRTFPSGALNRA